MPHYNNQPSLNSLAENDIGYSFGSGDANGNNQAGEAVVDGAQAGAQFAIGSRNPIGGDSGRTVVWDYLFDIAPGAISMQLEGALRDVEADYKAIGAAVTTAGGARTTATGVRAKFLRIKQNSITVGNATTLVARIMA